MLENKEEVTATVFIGDQTPAPESAIWVDFLNQKTPVFSGIERIGKKLAYPVIFISVDRPKRGSYTVSGELLIEDPSSTADEEITQIHSQRRERDIRDRPHIWLWTHRRWKHKPPS